MLNGNEKSYFEDIDITKYFDDYSKELIGISSRILTLDKNQMMQRENSECNCQVKFPSLWQIRFPSNCA